MRLVSSSSPSALKSRRALAWAMLLFVFEAVCVLGRAPRAVELRTPTADSEFVIVERPKGRTAQAQANS